MKKAFIISLFLLPMSLAAQTTTFTKEEWDLHQAQDKANIQAIDTLKAVKDSLEKQIRAYEALKSKMEGEIASLQADTAEMRAQLGNISDQSSKIDSMQLTIDELNGKVLAANANAKKSQARLANSRLYQKFNKKNVNGSIADLKSFDNFDDLEWAQQVLTLLEKYESQRNDLISVLSEAMSDPLHEEYGRSDVEQYKAKYREKIKNMPYYTEFYVKRDVQYSNRYLDNAIEYALKLLDSHNPNGRVKVDYSFLIDIL